MPAREGAHVVVGAKLSTAPCEALVPATQEGPALHSQESGTILGSAPLPSTDHRFLFTFPQGSQHCCEKGSKGFLTHKTPKRQYFDDLSMNDQKHVDFISFRIHLGMKIKGKRAWQNPTQVSSNP